MQGKKIYQEKFFNSFSLSSRVPENNFYRRLKGACNFDFLYKLTEDFYGSSGQKSIDPINFKKHLKFDNKRVKTGAASLVFAFSPRTLLQKCIGAFLKNPNLVCFLACGKNEAAYPESSGDLNDLVFLVLGGCATVTGVGF